MRAEDRFGLDAFLTEHPGMRVCPSTPGTVRLEGHLSFYADYDGGPALRDEYRLRMDVPLSFPRDLPLVQELDGRIPRDIDHHVYPGSGVLCLGSPFRLHLIACEAADLADFVWRGIVPYLYAASYREQTSGPYPFGELAHGRAGLLNDYARILGLNGPEQAARAFELLATKRRLANKKTCPCGCGRRLGVCQFNETIRDLRDQFGRTLFKKLCLQTHTELTAELIRWIRRARMRRLRLRLYNEEV